MGKPFSRGRVNWEGCLEEIESRAYNMTEEGRFKLAECSNLCRKAKKEILRKEYQQKAFREYRRLVSGVLAYSVKQQFDDIREALDQGSKEKDGAESKNYRGSEFNTFKDIGTQNRMKEELKSLLAENIREIRGKDGVEDEKTIDALKQSSLREIHKLLGKWNKPAVKNFLKNSPLFEGLDKAAAITTPVTELLRTQSQSTADSINNYPAQQNHSVIASSATSIAPTAHIHLAPTGFKEPVREVVRKEDTREKDWANMKYENNDEVLSLYLNQNAPSESYKKIFKTSLELNPAFPKSYEEILCLKVPLLGPQLPYENKTFFGDADQTRLVEMGLGNFIEELSAQLKAAGQIFIGGEGAVKDDPLEAMLHALAGGKVVLFEQLPDQHHVSVDTWVKILDPQNPQHFLDDPQLIFYSPLLLYTIFQLESRFGRKWHWVEALLKSHPLFRSFRLSLSLIFKLSVYLHFLAGEKLLFLHRQGLPHERQTNFAFFPAESSNKKKPTVGRKKKLRSNEKEEHSFRTFSDKLAREQARLTWHMPSPETQKANIFFNKLKYANEEKIKGPRRFRPSQLGKNNNPVKPKDVRLDRFPERNPDSILREEKKTPVSIVNFTKFLRKHHREEHERHPLIVEIDRNRKSMAGPAVQRGVR